MGKIARSNKDTFTIIYEGNKWRSKESVSGPGSTLKYTRRLRRQIPKIFKDLGIKTIFDAPCGDFNWFRKIPKFYDQYIGADVVPKLIEKNKELYENDKILFQEMDITVEAYPNADIWICRDCLLHLSFKSINECLTRFRESNIKYAMISNYPGATNEKDINNGAARPISLGKKPFSFPKPLIAIDDYVKGYPVRRMCIWKREDLCPDT